MKLILLFSPGDPKRKLNCIKRLDKIIFDQDEPFCEYEKCYWYVLKDGKRYIGFGGIYVGLNNGGFFARAGILKKYRGRGLQKKLIMAREKLAIKLDLDFVETYTSIDNYASINSLTRNGYYIVEPGELAKTKWLKFRKQLKNTSKS